MPVNHQSHLSKCPATSAKSTAKTVLASVQGHPGLHLTCTISYCAPRSGLSDHRFIQSCHWVIDAVLGGHAKLVALFLKAAGLSHHVTRKVAQPSSKWLIRDKMFSFSTLQMLGQSLHNLHTKSSPTPAVQLCCPIHHLLWGEIMRMI